jgi:hypothetical protein
MEMFLFVELQAATAGLALGKSGCFRQTRKKEIKTRLFSLVGPTMIAKKRLNRRYRLEFY